MIAKLADASGRFSPAAWALTVALWMAAPGAPQALAQDQQDPERQDRRMSTSDSLHIGQDEDGNQVTRITPPPPSSPNVDMGPIYVVPQVNQGQWGPVGPVVPGQPGRPGQQPGRPPGDRHGYGPGYGPGQGPGQNPGQGHGQNPGWSGNPGRPGQPGQPDRPGYPGQPGQPGYQPGQPGYPGQNTGQGPGGRPPVQPQPRVGQ